MLPKQLIQILILGVFLSAPAFAGRVELVSKADPVGPPKPVGVAVTSDVSADGRFVVFSSTSPNLVSGQQDSNDGDDIFLHDRTAGTTVLVSRRAGSTTVAAGSSSYNPRISGDGRWVAFCSYSGNLLAGQSDLFSSQGQIYLHDRITGTTVLVSRAASSPTQGGNGYSCFDLDLSADGRYVAFGSEAGDLVSPAGAAGDNNIYLFDRILSSVTLISHAAGSPTQRANGVSEFTSISAGGQWIAYLSRATNLVPGVTDVNAGLDLFLHDRVSGSTSLVSHAAGSPLATANAGVSYDWRLSADGAWILFTSPSTNLVTGQSDSGMTEDVFLWERTTGTSTLISHADGSPTTAANGTSSSPSISSDAEWITFTSEATNLVSGVTDSNFSSDLFVYRRSTGSTTLLSHAAGSPSITANGSTWGMPSADGDRVLLLSGATDLISGGTDANGVNDLFVREQASGNVALISHAEGSPGTTANDSAFAVRLSQDGNVVVFASDATDLTDPGDGDEASDVFAHDLTTGVTVGVSYSPAVSSSTAGGESILPSNGAPVSADGRFVVFVSGAPNLVPGQVDPNQNSPSEYERRDIFLFDRSSQSTILVSRSTASPTTTGNGTSSEPVISRDGRYIAFISKATDLVPGLTDETTTGDVFVFDRITETTLLASPGASSNTTRCIFCSSLQISGDGRFVAFTDSDFADIFDRETGSLQRIPTGDVNADLAFSDDGRYLTFSSQHTNVIAGQVDTNGGGDLFLYDRVTASRVLVSRSAGSATATGNGSVTSVPVISADGRFVVFASQATNHVTGQVDTNGAEDVFQYDRETGTIALVSRARTSPTTASNGRSLLGPASRDGRFLLVGSSGTDLIPGQQDTPDTYDLFLFDRLAGTMSLVSHRAGTLLAPGNRGIATIGISGDGSRVGFTSLSTDLIDGLDDQNDTTDLFLYDRSSGSLELVTRIPTSPGTTANGRTNPPVLSDDGRIVFFASYASDLVADDYNLNQDVFAFVPEDLDFYTVEPCRLFDSRRPEDGPAPSSGFATVVEINGACGIPATARALAVNLTVVQPGTAGYLTVYPGDGLPPLASNVNFSAGQTRTNNAVVRLAPSGNGTLAVRPMLAGGASVQVVIDVIGFFE